MRGRIVTLSLLFAVGGIAACGDDDGGGGGGGADAQPYIDAMAASILEDDDTAGAVTEEQAECIAESLINGIGADRLADAGVEPEDVGDDDTDVPEELADDFASGMIESFGDCDVSFFRTFMPDASDEVIACLEGAVDEDRLIEVIALGMKGDDDEAEALMQEESLAWLNACPDAFGG